MSEMTDFINDSQDDFYSMTEDWSANPVGNSLVGFIDTLDLAVDTDRYLQLFTAQLISSSNKRLEVKPIPKKGMVNSTEELLNRTIWVDREGNVENVLNMSPKHLQNILNLLSRRKTNLLLGCKTPEYKKYKDGYLFFEEVIKTSVLWKAAEYCINKKIK